MTNEKAPTTSAAGAEVCGNHDVNARTVIREPGRLMALGTPLALPLRVLEGYMGGSSRSSTTEVRRTVAMVARETQSPPWGGLG
jgi:hypothetical protein